MKKSITMLAFATMVVSGCADRQAGQFDYEQNFQGEGFVINNPNSTSTCGCGKSFQA